MAAQESRKVEVKQMADLYYAQINALSANDINALKKSKPADRVNMFCPAGESVSVQTLMLLNDIAASLKFIELENEMTLYFSLGQDSVQKNVNIIPLSGIKVPEQLLKTGSSEKKKRAKRQTAKPKEKTVKEDPEVEPAKVKEDDFVPPETETETVNSDISDSKAVKWIYPGAEKAFSEECGLDKDYVNRDAIVEFAAAAFYKYNEASKAIAEIKAKYGDEITETFKKKAASLIMYFDGAAFKKADV